MNLVQIWKNKGKIFEGVKARIFQSEHVEEIAQIRLNICQACPKLDSVGTHCALPGSQPCCSECGCKLAFKTRSLSSSCPLGYWPAEVSEAEEDAINESLL